MTVCIHCGNDIYATEQIDRLTNRRIDAEKERDEAFVHVENLYGKLKAGRGALKKLIAWVTTIYECPDCEGQYSRELGEFVHEGDCGLFECLEICKKSLKDV